MFYQSEGMSKRYNALAAQCRTVNPLMDLNTFVRSVLGGGTSSNSGGTVHKFAFIPPGGPSQNDQVSSSFFQLKDNTFVVDVIVARIVIRKNLCCSRFRN